MFPWLWALPGCCLDIPPSPDIFPCPSSLLVPPASPAQQGWHKEGGVSEGWDVPTALLVSLGMRIAANPYPRGFSINGKLLEELIYFGMI